MALYYNDPSSPYHGQPVTKNENGGYTVEGYPFNGGYRGRLLISRNDPPPPTSTEPPPGNNDYGSGYTGAQTTTPQPTSPGQQGINTSQQQQVGTLNGKPVYQKPDGTYYTTRDDGQGNQIEDMSFTDPQGMGGFVPSQTNSGGQTAPTAATTPQQTTSGTTPANQAQPTLTPEQQAAQAANQAKLQQLLADPTLTADQKAAIQAIYDAISNNDQSQADQIKAAIAAATEYSDPYFKAQTRMVLDSLDRGFQAIDDDLSYKESSLTRSLEALQRDIASAKDYLSFQQLQEMKNLERSFTQAIDTTKEDMAARGFTSSSIRSRKEQLIGDTYGDLRESSRRAFLEKEQSYTNQLNDAQTNTQAEVARLQQLAAQGKLDATRQAEAQVGSTALSAAGYTGGLGDIGGEIPAAQVRDANAFASQFVF